MYHGTTYSRAKSIVAEGWIYRTNGNRAVYRNTEPGFVSLAARPIEAAEFAARAYLNERLHNGTQKLVVFEVDVNANTVAVPFPVSWTVKMKKKQKETQDILSYHTQAAGCSDKARAKASGGRQPIEECGRTGL